MKARLTKKCNNMFISLRLYFFNMYMNFNSFFFMDFKFSIVFNFFIIVYILLAVKLYTGLRGIVQFKKYLYINFLSISSLILKKLNLGYALSASRQVFTFVITIIANLYRFCIGKILKNNFFNSF